MKNIIYLYVILFLVACSIEENPPKMTKQQTIVTQDYRLVVTAKEQKGLLILFPCFPCDIANTQKEFSIEKHALSKGISVLTLNFNQHLWMSLEEKKGLEELLLVVSKAYNLKLGNTYIGGFSSGGNVSLLLTDYLKSTNSPLQPKGVFIVDSPVDLLALYEIAQKNIAKNFSKPAVQESEWIVATFDKEFGVGDSSLQNYIRKAPYIHKVQSTQNLAHLKHVNIRLYSEPDTAWWMENRQTRYEDMNAYAIEQLAKNLEVLYGKEQVEFIQTVDKGYRANGERHPHSWSIVDKGSLVDWILEEK